MEYATSTGSFFDFVLPFFIHMRLQRSREYILLIFSINILLFLSQIQSKIYIENPIAPIFKWENKNNEFVLALAKHFNRPIFQ